MAPTPGGCSSEFALSKTAGVAGGGGIFVTILVMLQGPDGLLSDVTWPQAALLIALLLCVTAVVVSYNVSRGLAKSEARPHDEKTITINHTVD